jgi:hypothetical protein
VLASDQRRLDGGDQVGAARTVAAAGRGCLTRKRWRGPTPLNQPRSLSARQCRARNRHASNREVLYARDSAAHRTESKSTRPFGFETGRRQDANSLARIPPG